MTVNVEWTASAAISRAINLYSDFNWCKAVPKTTCCSFILKFLVFATVGPAVSKVLALLV